MGKKINIIIALCILCCLLIFIGTTDFEKVFSSIRQVGYRFVLLLLVTFIAYYLGALSWKYCLGKDSGSLSSIRLFLIRHTGETVSLINPASLAGGEAVKALLLKDDNIGKDTVIASILGSRVIMIVTQLLLFVMALAILIFQQGDRDMIHVDTHALLYALVTILLIAVAIRLCWYPLKKLGTRTKQGRLLKQKTRTLQLKTGNVLAELRHLFRHHKKMLLMACIFAILHWIAGAMEFYLILKFLGVKTGIAEALLVDMGVIFFKAAGAFIPGQIGIEEYGNKMMLLAVGIPGTEIWITASILRRARQLVWIAAGVGTYMLLFKKREKPYKKLNGDIIYKP
ncbi:lysylphosphatidylglycerol synthase transmembrane domain-containing protein [Pedobacter sp. AW31-3R]|uniref:lysylphosphatidylglycerol synthase transmembrane domain-containing protein n=1 Tax=Pedobacter sp. AW31-3R TaxID=3445781 RepID=UPI003FA10B48